MRRRTTLFPIALGPGILNSRDDQNMQTAFNADSSGLSPLHLFVALLIIGVFWMVIKLHEYVDFMRGGEKALLLLAVIASCVAIYINDRMRTTLTDKQIKIASLYCISTLSLTTLLVIILSTSEPSPVYRSFPEFYREMPEARTLKLEGLAVIFLILLPLGGALARLRIDKVWQHLPIFIAAFFVLCLSNHIISFVYYACGADFLDKLPTCHGPAIADIGGTTLAAIHAVQKGVNPYTIDILGDFDPTSVYRGYRYWPAMFLTYMPLASFFTTGWGAMRLTNFILDIIAVALIILLVHRRSGWLCGVFAASLYLMLPMLPRWFYGYASTDLAPTVLLLAALALYETRPGLAGVAVGLSVSAKLIPGLLMLVCCLPEVNRFRYVGGCVLGLIPTIAFCLLAPSDFIYNTVWALTPIDPSSWQYGAPSYMIGLTRLAFLLLMAGVSIVIILRPPDFFERCSLYVICIVAVLLTSHAHNNYMLWWIPFFCVLLNSPLCRILRLPGSLGNVAASRASRHKGR
jgi:hypothetical protein